MIHQSDMALLRRWTSRRDAEAFSELVSRHAGMVYATCKRVLVNHSDAEDVAQECFIRLAQASGEEVRTSLAGWLHRVAMTRSVDRTRKDARRGEREGRYQAERGTVTTPQWDDVQEHIDKAIDTLPDEHRVVIIAHFLERKSQRAIARELRLSRPAVSYRIQKGVAAVRAELKRQQITLSAAALSSLLMAHAVEAAPAASAAALGKLALLGAAGEGAIPVAGVKFGTLLGGTLLMKTKLWLAVPLLMLLAFGVYYAGERGDGNVDSEPSVQETLIPPAQPESTPEQELSSMPEEAAPEAPPPAIEVALETPPLSTLLGRALITNPDDYASISGFTQDKDGYPIEGATVLLVPP